MPSVIKRNGATMPFDSAKIANAIAKAIMATGELPLKLVSIKAQSLAIETEAHLIEKYGTDDFTASVEEIQDIVEEVLMRGNLSKTAKAYILYRKNHENIRNAVATAFDIKKKIESFTGYDVSVGKGLDGEALSWRRKENSTVTPTLGGLILANSGAMISNYWLNDIYDKEIAEAHTSAAIHIHDLSMLSGYCAGWSLRQLIQEGLGGVEGRITSAPAKHLSTLCNQMVNFLGIMQNEWAGAQAFSSFDTYLAPFVKADNLNYKQVKQCIQSFIYGVNTPSRWGCVDTETEVLSATGFKKYNELKEGDLIYTWKDGRLELNPVRKVIQKPFTGKLHAYKSRNYNQTVTPNHRMLVRQHNSDKYGIHRSEEIFDTKTPYALPVAFKESAIATDALNDDVITLAAMVYTDGSFDYRDGGLHKVVITKSPNRFGNEELKAALEALDLEYTLTEDNGEFGKINQYTLFGESARRVEAICGGKDRISDDFLSMNMTQANLFLNVWAALDGDGDKMLCQYDNDTIRDQLQQIALLAGCCSYLVSRQLPSGKTTNYVKLRKVNSIYPTERIEVEYDGIVWCPNVENGTAVFRKDGCVYISGQTQAPFTNVTIDWVCPPDMKDLPAIIGGEEMNFTYGDCKKEMDMVNRAFIEVMIEGDYNGRGFQYPIPTYSITKDFDWSETENNKLLFEMTAKYGIPYFSNYINSDMEPSDVRSMCCRLRLDLRELRKKSGGFFGSGESTGSIGVVTLNLPRAAYLSNDEAEFMTRIDNLMDIAARSLDIKRRVVTQLMKSGMYPYTEHYLGSFDNHFSTIGLVGMNEAVANAVWMESTNITTPEGQAFAKMVLDHMRERLKDYQEQYGALFNLEATPAESTTYRFAKHDVKDFPDIITAAKNGGAPYYTNSSHIPVGFTDDVFEALDLQDELQIRYTSGTVFHAFLGERLPDWRSAATLVRLIAENYKLPYYTLSPTYSVCRDHGYIAGEKIVCPKCGRPTEIYSRITGYYRPVKNWNDGKSNEFCHRKTYVVDTNKIEEDAASGCNNPEDGRERADTSNKIRLFATHACPKCKHIAALLESKGVPFEKIYAEENMDLCRQHNIRSVPVMILPDGIVMRDFTEIMNYVK